MIVLNCSGLTKSWNRKGSYLLGDLQCCRIEQTLYVLQARARYFLTLYVQTKEGAFVDLMCLRNTEHINAEDISFRGRPLAGIKHKQDDIRRAPTSFACVYCRITLARIFEFSVTARENFRTKGSEKLAV